MKTTSPAVPSKERRGLEAWACWVCEKEDKGKKSYEIIGCLNWGYKIDAKTNISHIPLKFSCGKPPGWDRAQSMWNAKKVRRSLLAERNSKLNKKHTRMWTGLTIRWLLFTVFSLGIACKKQPPSEVSSNNSETGVESLPQGADQQIEKISGVIAGLKVDQLITKGPLMGACGIYGELDFVSSNLGMSTYRHPISDALSVYFEFTSYDELADRLYKIYFYDEFAGE